MWIQGSVCVGPFYQASVPLSGDSGSCSSRVDRIKFIYCFLTGWGQGQDLVGSLHSLVFSSERLSGIVVPRGDTLGFYGFPI